MTVDILPTEQHRFYVEFELRPEEDRAASIEAGHPVFKDVEYAVITMPGGGLVVDKPITPDLLNEWKHGKNRKPPSPFALSAYNAWKEGQEAPLNGTPLSNWPGVTPAQLKMCVGANIRTVEDLADAHEDALRRMGMGARALKDKAAAYLRASETNKGSEQLSALMVRLEALEAAVRQKDETIAELKAELGEEPKPRGRPRKQD